ncbi:MAG: hypothetical protein JO202_08725 [Ktedonobacteraceae bacterium]|nr:hypothetical protein [Ktedonobacteraceae bacterium]
MNEIARELRVYTRHDMGVNAVDTLRSQISATLGQRFDFPTTLRGSTQHFNVFFDSSLGNAGASHADAVVAVCERDYGVVQAYFGSITPPGLPFNVIIASHISGAYHYGCGTVDLYCQDSSDTDFINMLVVAEEVEVFAYAQGKGWDCAATNGEGLSRVLAEALYPEKRVLVAPAWLDRGRPDYITANEDTDADIVSNACAVLFLNWLHSQLGFSWAQIVQAAGASLAQTYTNLTGQSDAYARFRAQIQAHFPEGMPSGLMVNNPFPL